MTNEYALLSIDDDVATITLNDPERYNPWSEPMRAGVKQAVDDAREAKPRCLVIEGAGDAFSAGGDVDQMRRMIDEARSHERSAEIQDEILPPIREIARFPAPVIAKIDGPAAGLGANLAIACDILLAREDAYIMFAFTNVGVSVDGGTSAFLPRLVGTNLAKELVFKGEKLGAERAKELGIFNHVYPEDEFEEKVQEEIETYANRPTVALRTAKRLIDDGASKSIERALADEAFYAAGPTDSADHLEGVEAFLEDREPKFRGE